MREPYLPTIPIVRSIECERRREIVDPVAVSVRWWGKELRVLMTHCVNDRTAPAAKCQTGTIVSVGGNRATEETRVCIKLEDGREVVVALEGAHLMNEREHVEVEWK